MERRKFSRKFVFAYARNRGLRAGGELGQYRLPECKAVFQETRLAIQLGAKKSGNVAEPGVYIGNVA